MKGTEGSRGKTAAPSDMMKLRRVRREDPKSSSPRLGSKSCEEARLRSPRLRSKFRVDYNENMQAFGGYYFGKSVEYRLVKGILKKPSTESKDEDDEEVTFGGSGRKTVENPMGKGTHMELRRSKRLVGDVESGQEGPMQGEAEAEVVGENDDGVIANDMVEITKHESKKKKKLFKKNKASEVGKVKPNEVVNSLGVKRKRGGDAGRLESNDDSERPPMKRGQKRYQNSYSQDFKMEVVEEVKVVGNAAKVAKFYSSKLGFRVSESTVRNWVRKSQESQEDEVVAQVGEEELLQDEAEGEIGEGEEDTDEEENNDEEAFEVDDEGEAKNVHFKKNEGEDEAEVGVIFDTHPVLVETPLTEAYKKLREVVLKKNMLKKKKELLEMEEKNLQKEEEEQRLLLKVLEKLKLKVMHLQRLK